MMSEMMHWLADGNYSLWPDMFALQLPVLEKILRPIVVYAFLLVGLRLAGKRELAQLNPFDLVVLLTLSNTVQNAIIGDDNTISGGIIGAATLLAVNYLVVRFTHAHPGAERLLEGTADVLVRDGKIQQDHLNRELMSISELTSAAHKQGIVSLADVEYATLEPSGNISFVVKKPDADTVRHGLIMDQLSAVMKELAELRAAAIGSTGTSPRPSP
jgi:uncharacterized membrane protein YcaP (DUF421 family)